MKKVIAALVSALFAGAVLAQGAAPAPAARAAKEFHVALILKSLSNPAIWKPDVIVRGS